MHRRVAALWIDALAVYGLARGIVAVAGWSGLRLALEPVLVAVWAAYGSALLWRYGQTIGKLVVGLRVVGVDGAALTGARAIGRELIAKWTIQVIVPIAVVRQIVGAAWIPTICDLAVVVAVTVVVASYAAIARRPIHDALARTRVIRTRDDRRCTPALLGLAASTAIAASIDVGEYVATGYVPSPLALYHRSGSVRPYAAFLGDQHTTPLDYMLGLFERFDIVVVSERMHAEATQWEFLARVVSDPRFIDRVGHVFTEYGPRNQQPELDRFMATPRLTDAEIEERARKLMRNMSIWPTWNRTNFYRYLRQLYRLNQTLPAGLRIHHHFAEVPLDWSTVTTDGYRTFERELVDRDRKMAERVIQKMGELRASGDLRPKALVVMNHRHGFGALRSPSGELEPNTTGYVFDALPGQVANVLFNGFVPVVNAPLQGGTWDAAFEAIDNRPCGFDFAGSPFGDDAFDLGLLPLSLRGRYRYRDAFTGFVFLNPLEDQYLEEGIPGYFDDGFADEANRRAKFLGSSYAGEQTAEISHFQGAPPFERTPLPIFAMQTKLAWLLLAGFGAALPLALAIGLRRRARKDRSPTSSTEVAGAGNESRRNVR